MAKKRTIYRDSKTGRFTSKSTWNRSKGHGGSRYVRSLIVIKGKRPRRPPVERVPLAPLPVFEWIVSFTYDKSGRSFDVIVTARDETEAESVAKEFLRRDPDAQRIARSRFHGWTAVPARGNRTDEDAGEAEYRGKSKN